MSSFELSPFKIKLEPEFVRDEQGRLIPEMIYGPLAVTDYPDISEYIKKMNKLIQKKAVQGVIKESEVPWVVWYELEAKQFRFSFRDSDHGANIYRIEVNPDICDIKPYGILADTDYEIVYEFYCC